MRLQLLILTALIGMATTSARAENWMFRPSYYSHDPVLNVRIGRQYAPGPLYTRPEGAYITSGYRHLQSNIVVGGQTVDQFHHFESWVQTGEQF
jgi:hypothetical protein